MITSVVASSTTPIDGACLPPTAPIYSLVLPNPTSFHTYVVDH
jgi:hypothetical protein